MNSPSARHLLDMQLPPRYRLTATTHPSDPVNFKAASFLDCSFPSGEIAIYGVDRVRNIAVSMVCRFQSSFRLDESIVKHGRFNKDEFSYYTYPENEGQFLMARLHHQIVQKRLRLLPVSGVWEEEDTWDMLREHVSAHSMRLESYISNGVGEIFISKRVLESWSYFRDVRKAYRGFIRHPVLVAALRRRRTGRY
jgi:hypothetical protein